MDCVSGNLDSQCEAKALDAFLRDVFLFVINSESNIFDKSVVVGKFIL